MGSITFRRALREQIGLIIGLAGASGSGKTMSALRLATGLAGGKPFAFIDTEAGRGKHYGDMFVFDHADIKAPFRPQNYQEAIAAADDAGYPVIVVDSFSHEHAGDGGLLDFHEEELDRMAGADWKKRDACNMAAWVKPKLSHKHLVSKMLQVRAHLILAFRAEQKIEMVKKDGRLEIVPKKIASGFSDWIPIAEKNILYELTASFLLTPDAPGVPKPIKLQEQHKAWFDVTKPITEAAGRKLAEWAAGGVTKEGAVGVAPPMTEPAAESANTAAAGAPSDPDDPAEPYRAKLRTALNSKAVNEVWRAIPDYLQQDCFATYTDKLKKLAGK